MITLENSLRAKEVAKILACSEGTVRDMAHSGELQYYKVGNRLRFEPSDVADFISKSKKKYSKVIEEGCNIFEMMSVGIV